MFQLTFWSVPPLLALALTGHTLYRARARTETPGTTALNWLAWCVVFWAAGELFATLTQSLLLKVIAMKVQTVGVAFLPLAWFAFAMTYARRMKKLPRSIVGALGIVPALTLVLAATNEWHHLVWSEMRLQPVGTYVSMSVDTGPWFDFHVVYAYSLILIATVILVWELSRTGAYRRAVVAVIAAPLVVGTLHLVHLSPYNPTPWFDPTVLGFACAALLLNNGVIRFGLLEAVPTMRNRVVELLSDGVVIIDRRGRIVDINPAGAAILGLKLDETLSRSIADHLRQSPLVPSLLRGQSGRISLENGSFYDVKSTVLAADAQGEPTELALVLRDVTQQHRDAEELKTAKAKFEKQAHVDDLTALANRRMFISRLEEEIRRVERSGLPLSLLLFDLDHFKRINDTHGHDVGDRVLSVIGSVTRDFKRSADVAARLGGEEFALLLPDTDGNGAIKVAQRLRSTIAETRISDNRGGGIQITASFGVATITRNGSVDQVLNSADKALYRAKNAGRNRVCTPE